VRIFFTVVFVLLLSPVQTAYAWGWDAHKLICAMAERQLTPDAKAMVDSLLEAGADLKGGRVNFAESCLWADDVKHSTRKDTYEHHFINVPDDAQTIDLSRDCEAVNCIAVGVQRALVYLTRETSGKRDVQRRAAALRYLGHYVGDLHQPLHIGNASDWGGNKIDIDWMGKESNLHALWDYEMLDSAGITYPQSTDFLMTIGEESDEQSILAWMNESLALGRSHGYVDVDGRPLKSGDRLGKAYLNRNKPVMFERISLAAHRLANLLNAIAADGKPSAFQLVID
jgi:hypothetical protein